MSAWVGSAHAREQPTCRISAAHRSVFLVCGLPARLTISGTPCLHTCIAPLCARLFRRFFGLPAVAASSQYDILIAIAIADCGTSDRLPCTQIFRSGSHFACLPGIHADCWARPFLSWCWISRASSKQPATTPSRLYPKADRLRLNPLIFFKGFHVWASSLNTL